MTEPTPWTRNSERMTSLLQTLREQIVLLPESPERSFAAEKFEELQQALWSAGIAERRNPDIRSIADKAREALLELGGTHRQANSLVQHLLNRGVF